MRNIKEILTPPKPTDARTTLRGRAEADRLVSTLETDGIVMLPNILSAEQLRGMQQAFASRLQQLRWNNFEGYSKTEPYRHMIEDVLMLDQGFVDLALHPLVKQILNNYLGTEYALTEAKGWKSLATKRDFHGWHGDSWYDQTVATEIHKEVKLALYLTDVHSGAFNFIRGTHQQRHPYDVKRAEAKTLPMSRLLEVKGQAGTVFLFDSSAVHRQGYPMLETRQAVFYAYHDPSIPLREEDVSYYRYHPLLLNAAFLGDLSEEDRRILGFGNKINFQPAFNRSERPPLSYRAFCTSYNARIRIIRLRERAIAIFKRVRRIV
ncbi:MAG: phytanoyl-CoA dioxygenase family protein [Acidobacteriota bacterium]